MACAQCRVDGTLTRRAASEIFADAVAAFGGPLGSCGAQDDAAVQVVKVPKSGGTVATTKQQQRQARERAIVAYFKGAEDELQPSLQKLKLSDFQMYKVANSIMSQPGLLPSGMTNAMNPTRSTLVEPSADMVRFSICGACQSRWRCGDGTTGVKDVVAVPHCDAECVRERAWCLMSQCVHRHPRVCNRRRGSSWQ